MVFKEYMAPMSDGTRLYTRCTLPDDSGRFPIIFSRSPYDDRAYIPAEHPGDFDACIRAGYAVVHQSCRGTARSEGVFVPFAMERSDGLDTLAWLRRQSFYGGEIYPQGASYCSYVHLAYLGTHQSDVKGAFLYVMPTDMYAGMTVNGLFKQDIITPWFSQQYHKNQCDSSAIQANYPALTLRRPHYAALDPYYEGGCPDYAAYLRSHEIWKSVPGPGEALNAMRDLTVPVLLMEGWYDIYIGAGTAMWEELPESVRAKSALLVGPWPHSCRVSRDWALEMPGGERPADLMLNWFNHLRAGERLNFMREGQIRYYTIGENAWHFAPHMPEGRRALTLWLNGASRLGTAPGERSERSYRYDPSDPTPFTGGANAFGTVRGGIVPDPEPNSRPDILSFVSEPLAEDVTLNGRVAFRLRVRTDGEDTAFFARLTVLRSGRYLPVQESIATLRRENPAYAPGDEAVVTMTSDPASWRFFRGERLRVDVASACWPIYAAHGNTAGDVACQTETRAALNTVITGLSCVTLSLN